MKLQSQIKINELYRDLAAKVGELSMQKDVIDKEISILRGRIESLNLLAPEMIKIEMELNKSDKA